MKNELKNEFKINRSQVLGLHRFFLRTISIRKEIRNFQPIFRCYFIGHETLYEKFIL